MPFVWEGGGIKKSNPYVQKIGVSKYLLFIFMCIKCNFVRRSELRKRGDYISGYGIVNNASFFFFTFKTIIIIGFRFVALYNLKFI